MSFTRFTSGKFHEKPIRPRAALSYPFKDKPNPDVTAKLYEQVYAVDRARFTPKITNRTGGPPGAPDTFSGGYLGPSDAADTSAYLLEESDPTPLTTRRATVRRLFGHVPADQTNPIPSRFITLPTPQNEILDADYLNAVDLEFNQQIGKGYVQGDALWSAGDLRLYRVKRPESSVAGRATGGTFTITYDGDTTGAIAWDADDATIAAAINALASVVSDGITVACTTALSTTGKLTIVSSFGAIPAGWPKKFTMGVGSLTVNTSQHAVTSVVNGNAQIIYLPEHLTITGHGFNPANRLATVVNNSSLLCLVSGYWGSVDADTIWVPTTDGGPVSYLLAGDFIREYAPGTKQVRMRLREEFFLPGVTGGISDDEDIPVPEGLESPEALLNALVTDSGWADYQSDGPSPWKGPIYRLAVTEILLDDL